ncbi:hypothetical protein BEH94_01335 [Candidatus Altiarchaeales archaeon WOR_SM1_SCG]|nr:hypothetical protein BEH94_01335 [Candidatus Altiarchaeales archaeon WOR_SM1_SCG]
MLKRLKVKNFKSLENFEVEFGKFNVLVGRNNSGKSNVIDCLKFLSELVENRDLSNTISKRGIQYKDMVHGRDYKNEISIEVCVELEGEEFTYKLSFSGVNEDIRISDDELIIRKGNNERAIKWERREHDFELVLLDGKKKDDIIGGEKIPIFSCVTHILRKTNEETQQSLHRFFEFMKNIKLYEFYPNEMKESGRRIRQPLQSYIVTENGDNILEVLHTLYLEHREVFERISELLTGAIEIEELKIMPQKTGMYMAIKEKNFREPFPLWSISDGTLRMISYITTLNTTDFFEFDKAKIKNPLFCFEEPENYIHMRLLEFLVDLMKNSDSQIILATHSPYFIDRCEPDELIIIEKENGKTTARKIDPERIKKEIVGYGGTLGEIYYSDEFKND